MAQPLRVLLLEHDPLDLELIGQAVTAQLPDAAVAFATSRTEFLAHLEAGPPDLVLSDGNVPGCEGLQSFYLARARAPRLPFFIVSGLEGGYDLRGLEALGVDGFVPKSRLETLGDSVRRGLEARSAAPADASLLEACERLVAVVKDLSLAKDLAGIMAVVRRAARDLTGADGATFVLREGGFCHYADEDAIGPLWRGQRFPMETCISGWAMTRRQPAVVENIHEDPRIPVSAYEPTFVRSVVMVPIRALDPIGAIGTYWAKPRLPAPREVRLLQALADTTAVAMENVRIRQELESRVQERTAELESFTHAVSHDLRAPIRHMQGFASILLKDRQSAEDDKGQVNAQRIVTAANRMSEMVEGLLDLSRVTHADLRRIPLDLAHLAREMAAECDTGDGPKVAFSAPESLPSEGDPALLRAVLQNLLANAWKFTSKKEAPRVEFGAEAGPEGHPVYFVRDNGAGFEPSAAHRLFGLFQRLHPEREFPGTGVGLATVQRIVQRHGGRIWAVGRPGEGATFHFTLQGGSGETSPRSPT